MFKDENWGYKELTILVLIAYTFSFAIRLIWIFQFKDNPSFLWDNQLMINTNDGYFFASAVDSLLNGVHIDNPRVEIAINSYPAMVYISYILAKFTPMSLETTILYAPAIISSLIVIPIILTAQLIRLPIVGFLSALLASIAWSYYNRTMIGYYDTDMFSVLLQSVILYMFLLTIYNRDKKNILLLSLAIIFYPLFYPQGLSLVYAMFILWTIYQLIYQKDKDDTYIFISIVSISLWSIPIYIKLLFIVGLFILIDKIKDKLDRKKIIYISIFFIFMFFIFGNIFGLIIEKVSTYLATGTKLEGLHFYSVIQTVREAGSISWDIVANRIIGGKVGLFFSIIGYILLVIRYKEFIIALPLIGVGIFSHWAGLRFTVYAVPIAGMSAVYLFWVIAENFIKGKIAQYSFVAIATAGLIYPNINHVIGYKVPTVLNNSEVKDLVALDKIASPKDYTLSWWDYGYPIWFYSDTSTLIDGAKHHNDNFIISKIMLSTSPQLVANLSRLAVETYSKGAESAKDYSKGARDTNNIPNEFKMYNKDGDAYHAGGGSVINLLLRNNQEDQKDPDIFLESLKSKDFKLPPKTRDIYLYLPYRMLNIFPTVSLFGNLDLKTGKKINDIAFYPTTVSKQDSNGILILANGFNFDLKKGLLYYNNKPIKVKTLAITEYKGNKLKKVVQNYYRDGTLSIVFMKSYKKFIIMDNQVFNSTFVQMFMLENYDKNLFELVVASPYSKIYKLKK